MKVSIVDLGLIRDLVGPEITPPLTFIAFVKSGDTAQIEYLIPGRAGKPQSDRVLETAKLLDNLLHAQPKQLDTSRDYSCLVFQAEDCPANVPSVSWQTRRDWEHIRLIPDLYYFNRRGYGDFLPPQNANLKPWNERKSLVFWRGSTTGILNVTLEKLESLPRYRLCAAAKSLGVAADVGIFSVVQAATPDDRDKISSKLLAEEVMKPFVALEGMAANKFIVDIDGNANSWNFLAKLRLGACILKVESSWIQLLEQKVVAWQHFVPVKADLSDFLPKVEWCLSNDDATREIASNGRELALSITYDEEFCAAAKVLHSALAPSLDPTAVISKRILV